MRHVDPALQTHLDSGATTLCTCWIVRPANGVAMGFTDHDGTVVVAGTPCKATSGFNATEAVRSLGLSPDTQDIEGALQSDAVTAEDIAAGVYDDAQVEVWSVNWADQDQAFHQRTMIVGEIARDAQTFRVELRGLTSLLDRVQGRSYARTCDAVVGDARCGVDLSAHALTARGIVVDMLDAKSFRCTGVDGYPQGWFAEGEVRWTSGANAGSIARAASVGGGTPTTIGLQEPPGRPMAPGDSFTIHAGCDQTLATCRDKFSNHLNFRGHPHIPWLSEGAGLRGQGRGARRSASRSMSAPTEAGQRVVEAARDWIGTPYAHQASVQDVGCDCLGLVRGVWRSVVGPEPEPVPPYGSHWAETSGTERLMGAALRHFQPVAVADRQAGDVLLFRMKPRSVAKHAGILSTDAHGETLIHAYEGNRVVEGALVPFWRSRIAAVFRFPTLR